MNDERKVSTEKRNSPCEAFLRLCELGLALKIKPLNQQEGCWEHQVDDHWWICINGHPEPRKNSDDFEVPAFNCVVKWNGWPAGMFDPGGGIIAAGSCANEGIFIDALVAARKRAGECVRSGVRLSRLRRRLRSRLLPNGETSRARSKRRWMNS